MRLSARVDYALRAVAELAAAQANNGTSTASGTSAASGTNAASGTSGPVDPVTAERLASAQGIPAKFLESILLQLRRGGIVTAQRGPDGGYRLARPAKDISLADVIRVVDGPLANVRGQRPEQVDYHGAARSLQDVWIALRANEREILDSVTLADVAAGTLPERVRALTDTPEAWV